MKTPNLLLVAIAGAGFLAMNLAAQDATSTANTPVVSPAVAQIVQLSQAKVGDDTIITFIQNSGTIYGLDANQIVYLKQQGVSSAVINAMLNQRTLLAAGGSQSDNSTATVAQPPTTVAQPTVTYVQTVPASTVYVIPNTQLYNYDASYYYPYYYFPYYAWPYPRVSLSFGFGGHWGGGYYRGGDFHGGFHNGGFHGVGFHGIGRR
ncbi:MAG TPA: hypothetical protein VMB22_03605 [Verrucomicrobiae bacterium]|nr:hypothetical protein [Verrucomicrobiae bacterium]